MCFNSHDEHIEKQRHLSNETTENQNQVKKFKYNCKKFINWNNFFHKFYKKGRQNSVLKHNFSITIAQAHASEFYEFLGTESSQ